MTKTYKNDHPNVSKLIRSEFGLAIYLPQIKSAGQSVSSAQNASLSDVPI